MDFGCLAGAQGRIAVDGNGSEARSHSASLSVSFGPTPAEEIVWTNPQGGGYDIAGNWDPARVPAEPDRVRFDLDGAYTVDLVGSRSVQRAVVHGSLLDLVGGTLALLAAPGGDPPLAIGGGATLTLRDSTLSSADIVVGDAPGPESVLRVADGGRLEPTNGLRIGDAGPGTLEIVGGTIAAGDVSVGSPESAGSAAAILAKTAGARAGVPLAGGRITVQASALGNGILKLEGAQRKVTVGNRGPGSIEVLEGGVVDNAGETIIGASPGPATVRIDGSADSDLRANWISGGTVTVGKDAVATLDILKSGLMRAPDMRIGAESTGVGEVTLDDLAEDLGLNGPFLGIADTLDVGDGGNGVLLAFGPTSRVEAQHLRLGVSLDGHGELTLLRGATVSVGDLDVGIEGSGDVDIGANDPFSIINGGMVFARSVNIAGAFGAPAVAVPSSVEVSGDDGLLSVTETLLIGDRDLSSGVTGGVGSLRISGGAALHVDGTNPGLIRLLNGDLVIEGVGSTLDSSLPGILPAADVAVLGGEFLIENGATAIADKVVINGPLDPDPDAPSHVPTLTVRIGTLQVAHTLNIGTPDDASRRGHLLLDDGVVEVADSVTCNPGCLVSGNGLLRIGSTEIDLRGDVLTHGDFSPGNSPGTIRIEGDFAQGSAGRLILQAAGLAAGAFDLLEITGKATLGGTLDIHFLDGFLPKQGDVIPFLSVDGKIAGAFDAVTVNGVAPGFDFTIGTTNGAVALTALNDAAPAPCSDAADADADGRGCDDNCPFVANSDQSDLDADLAGDACDPCTRGVPVVKPQLTLKKGILGFTGKLRFAAGVALNPLADGVRLLVTDATGQRVLDLTAPPGAFDKAGKQGWKKLGYASRTGAVTAVRLSQAKRTPEVVKFSVKGRLGGVDPATIARPIAAMLLLDASSAPTSACGEVRFTGPPAVNPLCTLARGALTCKPRKKR